MADPVVMRSMDRLSATVNRQRTSLAASLNLLEDELKTFVDKPPSNELQALQAALAAAKKHESTKSSSAEAQRMRVELGLANDEVTRLASQVRSLELRLKSRDDSVSLLRWIRASQPNVEMWVLVSCPDQAGGLICSSRDGGARPTLGCSGCAKPHGACVGQAH